MFNIYKPRLLLNEKICKANIRAMAAKARKHNLQFRPHFKTHQSSIIGEWFKEEGVNKITVSSVQMASYFARHNWQNITIAFPFNMLEIDEINALAEKIDLNLMLIHSESVQFLKEHLKHKVGIFIKIDCGYHRTGIPASHTEEINEICSRISQVHNLIFRGFLTHAGNSYNARSVQEIHTIHQKSLSQMTLLKKKFLHLNPIISIGDTPCCSVTENFNGVDEIRPGNFLFYDVTQNLLGACEAEQIAVGVACPVVAVHPDRTIIYGGGVHLSKEFLLDENGNKNYGLVTHLQKDGWSTPIPGGRVISLSQEHGIVNLPSDELEKIKLGDILVILPIHSCMTANLMREYYLFDGSRINHLNREITNNL